MAKLPYMPFYVGDYLLDTQPLSLNARGAWSDILCLMWRNQQCGTLTYTVSGWCKTLRCTEADFLTVLYELASFNICKILKDENKGTVSLTSRRLEREEKERELNRLYVERHRKRQSVRLLSGPHNPENQNQSHILESESEGIKKEKMKRECEGDGVRLKPSRPASLSDADWLKGLEENPAYRHISIPVEVGKMDAWLALPKNKHRKRTRAFVLNWLNKIEPPMAGASKPQPPPFPPANDPIARNSWRQAYGDPRQYGYQ